MQCKKTCIDLDKIDALLRTKFTVVRKNEFENHVSADFKVKTSKGTDIQVIVVKLKQDGEIVVLYMFNNEKTGRSNTIKRRFKTLEGLEKFIGFITRPREFKAYEVTEISPGKYRLCDNIKGTCRILSKEEAEKFMEK